MHSSEALIFFPQQQFRAYSGFLLVKAEDETRCFQSSLCQTLSCIVKFPVLVLLLSSRHCYPRLPPASKKRIPSAKDWLSSDLHSCCRDHGQEGNHPKFQDASSLPQASSSIRPPVSQRCPEWAENRVPEGVEARH